MNEFIHVMKRQNDACIAIMIFGVHGLVIQPIQVILLDYIMGVKLNVYNTIWVILRYPPSCLRDFNECVNTFLVPTF